MRTGLRSLMGFFPVTAGVSGLSASLSARRRLLGVVLSSLLGRPRRLPGLLAGLGTERLTRLTRLRTLSDLVGSEEACSAVRRHAGQCRAGETDQVERMLAVCVSTCEKATVWLA